MSALFSQLERRDFPNHIGSAEATTVDQPIAAEVVRQTQSLRTIEMRLAMNNDIMGDEDLLNYPNLTSILGRDLSLYHRYAVRILNRDKLINFHRPQSEWQGYNNESDNGSSQGYFSSSTIECNMQQPRPKAQRPTELLLSAKEFKDGHADTEAKGSQTTYLEQFWVCAKR